MSQSDHFPVIKFKKLSSNPILEEDQDKLVNELPLQISINDIPYTITMRTPGEELELALGLLFTEKIYQGPPLNMSVRNFDIMGNITHLNLKINEQALLKDIDHNRTLISTSSCGFCGKKDLTDIEFCNEQISDTFYLKVENIPALFEKMAHFQAIFLKTGASHAAALFNKEQKLLVVSEDVGRHNAVDKVIGKVLRTHNLNEAKILLVSGRISYEIVLKAFRAKIPIIMAVSAPTSFAVEIAQSAGLTLVGFCRNDRATIYSYPKRICINEIL